MRHFIDRYPLFLRRSPEFRDLQQALEPELLELWAARDGALEQLCVETADWGLRYWEQTLGIPVDGEREPELRRNRVRVKLLGADVTTVEAVRRAAELWSGHPAEVTEYPNEFWFEIAFTGTDGIPPDLEGLAAALREVLPAHLGWGLAFFANSDAALNIGAFTELSASLEVWPQVVNELESDGSAVMGGVLEYHRTLELRPIENKKEETA